MRLRTIAAGALLVATACSGAAPPPPETTEPPLTTLPPVSSTTTTPRPTLPPPPEGDVCASFGPPESLGSLASAELRETSGIAASRTHPGVLWAHNDSGDAAAVHAIGIDGSDLGRFRLANSLAIDWEDMAVGPGPDAALDYLYLGDIGDNLEIRSRLPIYRIPEPIPDRAGGLVEDVETFTVTYGEAGSFNAEAMAIDPFGAALYVITKRDDADTQTVFRAPLGDLVPGGVTLLTPVAVLDLGPGTEVTGADFSADGGLLALRGYSQVWIWTRTTPDAAAVFASAPCEAPSPEERQGEAIAFDPVRLGYFTVSEGTGAAVNYVGAEPP